MTNTNSRSRTFLVTHLEDEWLIVSTETPRFCLSAPTEEEAIEKAKRAIAYHRSLTSTAMVAPPVRTQRIVTPVYEREVFYA